MGRIFRRIRFIDGTTSVEANFAGEGGVGVRRTVLHKKMVERAEECGVELLWNSPVTRIFRGGAVLGTKLIEAKWIICADGVLSRVIPWSCLDAGARRAILSNWRNSVIVE